MEGTVESNKKEEVKVHIRNKSFQRVLNLHRNLQVWVRQLLISTSSRSNLKYLCNKKAQIVLCSIDSKSKRKFMLKNIIGIKTNQVYFQILNLNWLLNQQNINLYLAINCQLISLKSNLIVCKTLTMRNGSSVFKSSEDGNQRTKIQSIRCLKGFKVLLGLLWEKSKKFSRCIRYRWKLLLKFKSINKSSMMKLCNKITLTNSSFHTQKTLNNLLKLK